MEAFLVSTLVVGLAEIGDKTQILAMMLADKVSDDAQVIEVRDGYLIAPDRPGLGISLDDAGLARHPPRSADLSHAPLREDGSVAIR